MANEFLTLKTPKNLVKPTFMVAGFTQWANAGDVSSGVPEYLINKLNARKIGHISKGNFYLFQMPESHYLLRPPVNYVEGFEEYYEEEPDNDFYYAEINKTGLVIFIGTEPNMHEDIYVNSLLDAAQTLGVQRVIVPEGVGGEIPFEKERNVSCIYTPKHLKQELLNYAFSFSNYDKTATIGMVVNHYCQQRGLECVKMSVFTPSYEISISFSSDRRAIYDILRRIRYMVGINLDLKDLEADSRSQIAEFRDTIRQLYQTNPELEPKISAYMEQVKNNFQELPFKEPTRIPDIFLKEFSEDS